MLTGRCGPTPLPFVTQRLKELTGPVPFNSSSKEQSQGPLTVVSVTEMGVPFLGWGVGGVVTLPCSNVSTPWEIAETILLSVQMECSAW